MYNLKTNHERIIFESKGFRILELLDQHFDFDENFGDYFSASHNPGVSAKKLSKQRNELLLKVENEGVYGYILEKWDSSVGCGWKEVGSCFGFVGPYNEYVPEQNHYIVDELKGLIK